MISIIYIYTNYKLNLLLKILNSLNNYKIFIFPTGSQLHNYIHLYCNKNNINNGKNCISVTKRLVVVVAVVVVAVVVVAAVVAVVVVVVVIVVFVIIIIIITVGDVVELWVSAEGGRRNRRRRRSTRISTMRRRYSELLRMSQLMAIYRQQHIKLPGM